MTRTMESKVTAKHLQRTAFLYVRQSTVRQVFENPESTARQYALRRRAVALGWPEEQVVVIDRDQGQSGASAVDRAGFQQLVSEVGLGRAGIVLGLEVSRLARNSSDWHRLLEICGLRGTLILDEDGLYDPTDFNDRLLLGLKGAMSEAELHVLRARLKGGMRNKAERGELRQRLPVGFVYDAQNRVVLDPDRQVQSSIRMLFDTFERLGSELATVRELGSKNLQFPTRPHFGPHKGELIWNPLTESRIDGVLHNPRYAGAYVYGRRQQELGPDGRVVVRPHPRDRWHVLLREAHPGYITWERMELNLQQLRGNSRCTKGNRRYPPREGPALLQGLALCMRCGARMTVRYYTQRTKVYPYYICQGSGNVLAGPRCQVIPGMNIDAAISELLLEVVTPVALDVALAVQEELEAGIEQADRLRYQQVERVQYEAELARRRFMQVDPDNRLVADSLEAEWNTKLRELAQAREVYGQLRQQDRLALDETKKARIRELASDFPRVWKSPSTPARERKRMVGLLVEDVALDKTEELLVQVRFRGGATRSLHLPRPLAAWERRQLPHSVVNEIDRLLDEHTYGKIASILNERGVASGTGKSFDGDRVKKVRRAYGLAGREERLRAKGLLTLEQLAAKLHRHKETIKLQLRQGRLPVRAYPLDDAGQCMYDDPAGSTPTAEPAVARPEEV